MLAFLSANSQYDKPYAKCRQQIDKLKEYIKRLQKEKFPIPNILRQRANKDKENNELFTLPSKAYKFDVRCWYAHWGKIYGLDFSSCSDRIVSAAQDGKLLISDTNNANKLIGIPLRTSYVMDCSFSPNGKYVASGGVDSLCTIFNIENNVGWEYKRPSQELQGHEGYISAMEYVDDNQIMTASGDETSILWDIEKLKPNTIFKGHVSDVRDISMHANRSVFVTVSTDTSAKIWDIRSSHAAATFQMPSEIDCDDMNCCRWFPNGYDFIFATGGEDDGVRLWDWRSTQQLNIYDHDRNDNFASVDSIDFSKSGYYLIAGYDRGLCCVAWNTMTGEKEFELDHPTKVSCIRVSPDGYQIATGCWDGNVRFWSMSV